MLFVCIDWGLELLCMEDFVRMYVWEYGLLLWSSYLSLRFLCWECLLLYYEGFVWDWEFVFVLFFVLLDLGIKMGWFGEDEVLCIFCVIYIGCRWYFVILYIFV